MNYPKKNIPQFIISAFLIFFNAIMIIFPKEIFFGAKSGLEIWFYTVVPSLLPFMITVNCLTETGIPRLLGQYAGSVSRKLLNMSGAQAFVMLVGITAGFPMGLKTAAQLYREGELTKNEVYRLMFCCNNAGILFILGTVGTGFFGDIGVGRFILLCSLLSVFTVAAVTGIFLPPQSAKPTDAQLVPFGQKTLTKAFFNAGKSIMFIGGYIILFSVLMQVFEILHIFDGLRAFFAAAGLEQSIAKAVAAGIFEVTNGCKYAAGSSKTAVITAAFLCGWGGLSVHAQSMEFLNDTDLSCLPYLFGKAVTAILCIFYALLLWKYFFL